MLIIGIHPQNMDVEALDALKTKIRAFFEDGEGVAVGVTSLYFEKMGAG